MAKHSINTQSGLLLLSTATPQNIIRLLVRFGAGSRSRGPQTLPRAFASPSSNGLLNHRDFGCGHWSQEKSWDHKELAPALQPHLSLPCGRPRAVYFWCAFLGSHFPLPQRFHFFCPFPSVAGFSSSNQPECFKSSNSCGLKSM